MTTNEPKAKVYLSPLQQISHFISQLELYFILHFKVLMGLAIKCPILATVFVSFSSLKALHQITCSHYAPSPSPPSLLCCEMGKGCHSICPQQLGIRIFTTLTTSLGTLWILFKMPFWNQCQDRLLSIIKDNL